MPGWEASEDAEVVAGSDINGAQATANVMIIEDEAVIAMDLEAIVTSLVPDTPLMPTENVSSSSTTESALTVTLANRVSFTDPPEKLTVPLPST